MSVNLPPQAYTRDVMGQAYEWLQSQPTKVREMATSMDSMVTLYLQHRRRGDSAPMVSTTPVSSQKFKEDLQSLANGIKNFDEFPSAQSSLPLNTKPEPPPQVQTPASSNNSSAKSEASNALVLNLDSRTQSSLEKVRKSLNLSSHEEALRMLVELGLDRVKEILPKS